MNYEALYRVSRNSDERRYAKPRRDAAKLLRLSIVVPTFNESENVNELLRRIELSLNGIDWEIIFVDDDSPDSTATIVRNIARTESRVRCLQRIGRRGLSSACVEGALATSAPIIAIMDGDLQHDEAVLPKMLAAIEQENADLVIGTRYANGGSVADWDKSRRKMSRVATMVSKLVLRKHVSDPMSGFFMFRRYVFDSTVRNLSGIGFKILLDILATVKEPLRIAEVPYRFRNRFAGESKLDEFVIWEYGMLLADKTVGKFVPVRFFAFALVGGLGLIVHMVSLMLILKGLNFNFTVAQSIATTATMVFNFTLNNLLTYRDRRLKSWRWLKGLVSFMAACSIGALANVGIATYLYENSTDWTLAAMAGLLIGGVWNYAVTYVYAWGKSR